jgi:hypothetical protein
VARAGLRAPISISEAPRNAGFVWKFERPLKIRSYFGARWRGTQSLVFRIGTHFGVTEGVALSFD